MATSAKINRNTCHGLAVMGVRVLDDAHMTCVAAEVESEHALRAWFKGRLSVFLCRRVVQSGSRSPKWILNASSAVVQLRVRVHCGTAFMRAREMSFRAACSLGKWPLVFSALRSCRLSASMAFVV